MLIINLIHTFVCYSAAKKVLIINLIHTFVCYSGAKKVLIMNWIHTFVCYSGAKKEKATYGREGKAAKYSSRIWVGWDFCICKEKHAKSKTASIKTDLIVSLLLVWTFFLALKDILTIIFYQYILPLIFSSPGPKVQVNYCHHLTSVVCRL